MKPSTHRGRLQSVDDPNLDLAASLTFDRSEVHIKSDGQTFGEWALDSFEVERQEENRFRLVIGGEAWTFAAEDPAHFMVTSKQVLAEPAGSRMRRLFRRLGSAGITFGAFSLAVATTLTAFAGGVLVARYRLDNNVGVAAAVVVVIILLSLIRVSASRRLTPPPSVAARSLERRPARVSQAVSSRRGAQANGAGLPGSVTMRESNREPYPAITSIESARSSDPPPIDIAAHNGGEIPEENEPHPVSVSGAGIAAVEEAPGSPQTEPAEHATETIVPEPTETGPATAKETPEETLAEENGDGEPRTVAIPEETDLTSIKGIGPAFAKRLNELGVHDAVDLANLDEDDVTLIVEYLGRFGQRLVTDDWVGQARRHVGID